MMLEKFSATNQDLNAQIPKDAQCWSIRLTFQLNNLAKLQKFENSKKNLSIFLKFIFKKLRKLQIFDFLILKFYINVENEIQIIDYYFHI